MIEQNEKTAEEILTPLRGKGNFINCIDYEDALKAMKDYAVLLKCDYRDGEKVNVHPSMILKSTNEKPEKTGYIFVITNEGKRTVYNYTGSTMSFITLRENYKSWVDESSQIEFNTSENEKVEKCSDCGSADDIRKWEPGSNYQCHSCYKDDKHFEDEYQ